MKDNDIINNEQKNTSDIQNKEIENIDKEDGYESQTFSVVENIEVVKREEEFTSKKLLYVRKMSSFEKLFWIVLFLFFIAYMFLVIMASKNSSSSIADNNKSNISSPGIIQEIEVIVNSDRIRKNLENNKTVEEIKTNLKKNIFILDKTIDKEINYAFHSVYSNIDSFLDFHYSVIGEYIELGGMATGKMEKMIEEKLFGSDFSIRMDDALHVVSDEYEIRLSDHFNFISQEATVQVDMNLNSKIVTELKDKIDQNMKIQGAKIATLVTAKVAPAIVKIAVTKITAKSSSKIAAKLAIKLGAKSTAAATGAAGGALCGPAFWICSPIAAGVLWFGTDAVVSSLDELYNRDEFKQDIMDSLVRQQNDLKKKLKKTYQDSAHKLSEEIIVKYKQTPNKETKRVRVKEKIGL